jgi:hypothetical protein
MKNSVIILHSILRNFRLRRILAKVNSAKIKATGLSETLVITYEYTAGEGGCHACVQSFPELSAVKRPEGRSEHNY